MKVSHMLLNCSSSPAHGELMTQAIYVWDESVSDYETTKHISLNLVIRAAALDRGKIFDPALKAYHA